MRTRYADRREAGRVLADELRSLAGRDDVVVLGLPRGGVPVAFEVAQALGAPLDVMIVRKLGVPGQEELAMGAVASGGVRVLNDSVVSQLRIPAEVIDRVASAEWEELSRRERAYRGDRPAPEVRGNTVVLVDDGLATGATMKAAVRAVRQRGAAGVIVAVPVAPPSVAESFDGEVDRVVCPLAPPMFQGVGQWYDDFSQTTDDEVCALLAEAQRSAAP